jgi:hypothetical protein
VRRLVRSFRRLWTEQMTRDSLSAAGRDRREKRLNRRFALMFPKTSSNGQFPLRVEAVASSLAGRSSIALRSRAGSRPSFRRSARRLAFMVAVAAELSGTGYPVMGMQDEVPESAHH